MKVTFYINGCEYTSEMSDDSFNDLVSVIETKGPQVLYFNDAKILIPRNAQWHIKVDG